MRINISNDALPGWQSERVPTEGSELERHDVFRRGHYVGSVVYRRRRLRGGGSMYGWQDAKAARQSALMPRVDAVRMLAARRADYLAAVEREEPGL